MPVKLPSASPGFPGQTEIHHPAEIGSDHSVAFPLSNTQKYGKLKIGSANWHNSGNVEPVQIRYNPTQRALIIYLPSENLMDESGGVDYLYWHIAG